MKDPIIEIKGKQKKGKENYNCDPQINNAGSTNGSRSSRRDNGAGSARISHVPDTDDSDAH